MLTRGSARNHKYHICLTREELVALNDESHEVESKMRELLQREVDRLNGRS